MPIDPAPFLSTIIVTSAALVAIVGGLLVARFVTLDSDEQTNRKNLADAEGRLKAARGRADSAGQDLRFWFARQFLHDDRVLSALIEGRTDLDDLMRLAPCELTRDQLQSFVADIVADIANALRYFDADETADRIAAANYDWDQFHTMCDDIPDQRWPRAWAQVFEKIADKRYADDRPERFQRDPMGTLRTGELSPSYFRSTLEAEAGKLTDFGAISARREDELIDAHTRARQQVDDFEAEVRRLRQAHTEITRPDARLWWGVGILVVYAVIGVALPAWLMAFGPTDLARVRWVFYPFAGGLAALMIYIVLYLVQLTRRRSADLSSSPGQQESVI